MLLTDPAKSQSKKRDLDTPRSETPEETDAEQVEANLSPLHALNSPCKLQSNKSDLDTKRSETPEDTDAEEVDDILLNDPSHEQHEAEYSSDEELVYPPVCLPCFSQSYLS